MQNGVRVRIGGLKSGIELWLGFNSAVLFLRLSDSALCLTGIFKPVVHTFSTYGNEKRLQYTEHRVNNLKQSKTSLICCMG